MTIHAAAESVAEKIRRSGYLEIIAHNDADGIAGGAVLAHAMARAGLRFRLRIRGEIADADLNREQAYLLCDIGAGREGLPAETIVIDHHEARFSGKYHLNPRIFGLDGDRDLSSSGAAYLVANRLGDNRDLAGLAMLGIIGDGQAISGENLEIFNDGAANSIISVHRGIRLAGRDIPEKLLTATSPILDGISGDEPAVKEITGQAGADGKYDLRRILTSGVLSAIPFHNAACVEAIYGDTYGLEREVIADAHSFAAVIDACGKTGHGDLAMSLCLRNSGDLGAAWEMTRLHRLNVIAAFRVTVVQDAPSGIYTVEHPDLASDVADALSCRNIRTSPIAVISRSGDMCQISARCPDTGAADLGEVIRTLAQECGGSGGGHRYRAGATIPCSRAETFRKGWAAAVAA